MRASTSRLWSWNAAFSSSTSSWTRPIASRRSAPRSTRTWSRRPSRPSRCSCCCSNRPSSARMRDGTEVHPHLVEAPLQTVPLLLLLLEPPLQRPHAVLEVDLQRGHCPVRGGALLLHPSLHVRQASVG